MNRIIIIGNGFDLAHKLETSFYDFIASYLRNVVIELRSNNRYGDGLIKVLINTEHPCSYKEGEDLPSVNIDDNKSVMDFFVRHMKKSKVNFDQLRMDLPKIEIGSDIYAFSHLLKQVLFRITINKNWVDIEQEYFDLLVQIRKNLKGFNNQEVIKTINEINNQLAFLKSKLGEYLSGLNAHRAMYIDGIVAQFQDSNKKRDFICDISGKGKKPSKLYFVNFNYTNTLKQYLRDIESIPHEVNHIHGSLCGNYGQPIFGYADDLNEDFQSFESEKINELYDNIKTFAYNEEANYANLMRTLNEEDYQVAIYGHSCGLSDRTLLNKIFEHKNCQSIKVFYYQEGEKDDFKEKRYAIYRLFEDKTLLNDRLVNKKDSEAMAQMEKVIIDKTSSN